MYVYIHICMYIQTSAKRHGDWRASLKNSLTTQRTKSTVSLYSCSKCKSVGERVCACICACVWVWVMRVCVCVGLCVCACACLRVYGLKCV